MDVCVSKVDCMSSLYVIRARAWEALENPKLAVVWYKKALKTDPFCYEAFHSLMSRNMLSQKDEQKLLSSLPSDCQAAWIKTLYTCLCSKVRCLLARNLLVDNQWWLFAVH